LWANGQLLGMFELGDCVVPLPAGIIDEARILEVELRHSNAVAPAELGQSPDTRKLAYCLESLAYSRVD